MDVSMIASVVAALQPILNWVAPISMASIFLSFIRSFFD